MVIKTCIYCQHLQNARPVKQYRLVLACIGDAILGRHWLTKALPSLPFPYVTCGTCGSSYWNERFLRMCLLLIVINLLTIITTIIDIHFSKPLNGHELCLHTDPFLYSLPLSASRAYWPPQRSERFAQGGPRGMGPGNQGYGRVREEFDGPSKKPRF